VAPANTASVLVAVSGVLQDPSTYSVSGLTLTFSGAPPTGTGNISARYLGIPASGVTTTAYRTVTEFTATAGQTTFTPPSYTVGFISVFRNGVLLGSADYTATNGTTVVLTTGATAGDLVTTESFLVSSVLNAIPATAGSVSDSNIVSVSASKLTGTQTIPSATLPVGSVLQVVQSSTTTVTSTASTSPVATSLTASITPKFNTSKILIQFHISSYTRATNGQGFFYIYKNGSNVSGTAIFGNGYGVTSVISTMSNQYLDSPATTSSTTYTIYMAALTNTISSNDSSSTNTITLMEIAG
jgi:hypothetical protein